MGTVLCMSEHKVRVLFDTAGSRTVSRVSSRNGDSMMLPLQVAWAATIHKAQGATLDRACVDLSFSFGHAQAYVALSRVRDVKDLEIVGLTLSKLNSVDKTALRWYNEIREASEERLAALERAEETRFVG
jgi:ATP-dependent exoDNAse (exonuclease V) alpha subunit